MNEWLPEFHCVGDLWLTLFDDTAMHLEDALHWIRYHRTLDVAAKGNSPVFTYRVRNVVTGVIITL